MIFTIIISILIFIFIYPIIIYPIILFILDKLFGKDLKHDYDFQPPVTVLIAAYNEELMIEETIKSVLNSDYPKDRIEILVGSDGSSDKTGDIVKKMILRFPQIKLFEYPRSGKNTVINNLLDEASHDFLYILDADLRFDANSIRNSISLMIDQEIGCVMMDIKGAEKLDVNIDYNSGQLGEGLYTKYENYLRTKESRIKTSVNVIGTYVIRKESVKKLPNSAVCDDFYIVLQVSLQGKRAVFCPNSSIYDMRSKTANEEMRRRARMSAGSLATTLTLPKLLNPFQGLVSIFFISHKLIRYNFCWLMLIIAALTGFLFAENPTYFYILAAFQLLFYFLSFLGYLLDIKGKTIRLFSLPYYFVMVNVGWFLGFFKFMFGKTTSIWERMDS